MCVGHQISEWPLLRMPTALHGSYRELRVIFLTQKSLFTKWRHRLTDLVLSPKTDVKSAKVKATSTQTQNIKQLSVMAAVNNTSHDSEPRWRNSIMEYMVNISLCSHYKCTLRRLNGPSNLRGKMIAVDGSNFRPTGLRAFVND